MQYCWVEQCGAFACVNGFYISQEFNGMIFRVRHVCLLRPQMPRMDEAPEHWIVRVLWWSWIPLSTYAKLMDLALCWLVWLEVLHLGCSWLAYCQICHSQVMNVRHNQYSIITWQVHISLLTTTSIQNVDSNALCCASQIWLKSSNSHQRQNVLLPSGKILSHGA